MGLRQARKAWVGTLPNGTCAMGMTAAAPRCCLHRPGRSCPTCPTPHPHGRLSQSAPRHASGMRCAPVWLSTRRPGRCCIKVFGPSPPPPHPPTHWGPQPRRTLAPVAPRAIARALPIPREAPVTMQTGFSAAGQSHVGVCGQRCHVTPHATPCDQACMLARCWPCMGMNACERPATGQQQNQQQHRGAADGPHAHVGRAYHAAR